MDNASTIIIDVSVNEFSKIIIETNNGKRYYSDLSSMSTVYCYPNDLIEWKKVSIDSYGLSLI